jgi:transposase
LSPERLVVIDATWATTHMARRHGRAQRGQRVVAPVPHGHWKTSTLLAARRHDPITAPCVFAGASNGERFRADVEPALAPTLQSGDIVIMDHLGAHKVAGVRAAIEARAARLLYLPPYSPDLNPIEQAFAKNAAADRRHPHHRRALARHRSRPGRLQPHRMPQLLRPRRLCSV